MGQKPTVRKWEVVAGDHFERDLELYADDRGTQHWLVAGATAEAIIRREPRTSSPQLAAFTIELAPSDARGGASHVDHTVRLSLDEDTTAALPTNIVLKSALRLTGTDGEPFTPLFIDLLVRSTTNG